MTRQQPRKGLENLSQGTEGVSTYVVVAKPPWIDALIEVLE